MCSQKVSKPHSQVCSCESGRWKREPSRCVIMILSSQLVYMWMHDCFWIVSFLLSRLLYFFLFVHSNRRNNIDALKSRNISRTEWVSCRALMLSWTFRCTGICCQCTFGSPRTPFHTFIHFFTLLSAFFSVSFAFVPLSNFSNLYIIYKKKVSKKVSFTISSKASIIKMSIFGKTFNFYTFYQWSRSLPVQNEIPTTTTKEFDNRFLLQKCYDEVVKV